MIIKLLWELTGGVVVNIFTNESLQTYFIKFQQPLLETVQMSLIGTMFGAVLGFVIALLSSEIFVGTKFIYMPFRILGSVLRSIPTLMYAAIFVVLFGSGSVAGIAAVTIFSVTIIASFTDSTPALEAK